MSVRDQERNRAKILDLTAQLWREQGRLDLDQVDGTFYVHVCMADHIAELQREAKEPEKHDRYVDAHIRRFLPNAPQSTKSYFVVPKRPCLRDAVDLSSINYGGRLTAQGEMIRQANQRGIEGIVGLAWVRLGIRNREWTGADVAREFVRRTPLNPPGQGVLDTPRPPYPDNEDLSLIGATLYKDGEYGIRMYWNPDVAIPEDVADADSNLNLERLYRQSPPEVWDEDRRLKLLIDYSDPHWEIVTWPPMVLVAVAEPLPPESVIAEYYDRVVIEQRHWNQHLLGAKNGQNVPTAIRTWATALLIKTGLTFGQAVGRLHYESKAIDTGQVSQQKYGEDRRLLKERVPEAEPFV